MFESYTQDLEKYYLILNESFNYKVFPCFLFHKEIIITGFFSLQIRLFTNNTL